MPEKTSEKREMSTVEFFCRDALRERIAPPSIGSVKARIVAGARALGWSYTRTRDAWYADPKISIKPHELFRIEAVSGLVYAREEMRKNDEAIERANALLAGEDARFIRTMVAALREALGLRDRPRA